MICNTCDLTRVKTGDSTTKCRCWICVAKKAKWDKITIQRNDKAELYLKGIK